MVGEAGLDLGGLDADAAELDLEVPSAAVDELAVGAQGGEVAGCEAPCSVRCAAEGLLRELRLAMVSEGEEAALEVELADGAGRDGASSGVEELGSAAGQGPSDRDVGAGLGEVEAGCGGVCGDLAGAVEVVDAGVLVQSGCEAVEQSALEGLAAEMEDAQGQGLVGFRVCVEEGVEQGGGEDEARDAVLPDEACEGCGVPGLVREGDEDRDAGEQGMEELCKDVDEGGGGLEAGALAVLGGGGLASPEDAVEQGAAGEDDGLGPSGGAGGVDEGGGPVGVSGLRVLGGVAGAGFGGVGLEAGDACEVEGVEARGLCDEGAGAGDAGDVAQGGIRPCGIEGCWQQAGAQAGQEGSGVGASGGEQQEHDVAGGEPGLPEGEVPVGGVLAQLGGARKAAAVLVEQRRCLARRPQSPVQNQP